MNLSALKELMILRVVEDHPAHGYALSEMLADGIGWTLGLTLPTIYTVLQRLEKRGWLESSADRAGRYPERQVYRLTPEGKAGYTELLGRTMSKGGVSIQPFAALILHADELPAEMRTETLTRLREERTALHQSLTAFPSHDGAGGTAVAYMIRQVALEIQTLDELLEADDTSGRG